MRNNHINNYSCYFIEYKQICLLFTKLTFISTKNFFFSLFFFLNVYDSECYR